MRHWRPARRLLAAGILMLGAGVSLTATAGPATASLVRPVAMAAPGPAQVAELTASDGASGDYFGGPVAVTPDGNTALIAAPGRAGFVGAVYVFTRTRTGWAQAAELTADDPASHDFGWSVAITADGDTALIGAPATDSDTGAAFVFTRTRTGWAQTAELTAADGADGNSFGWSVAITPDGSTALVGATYRDSGSGAAYVFTRTRTGWQQTSELTGASGDYFGTSVAMTADGNTALISAPAADDATGAVFAFTRTRTGWAQTAELTAAGGASGDTFGDSVAVTPDGTTALIGASGRDSQTGAAYVFTRTRTGWQQASELTAAGGASGDGFGDSVAVTADGATALIGAPGRDSQTGAAYVFTLTRTGWQQASELTAAGGASGDSFGGYTAVTADGTTALIGAPGRDDNTGAVYAFTLPQSW